MDALMCIYAVITSNKIKLGTGERQPIHIYFKFLNSCLPPLMQGPGL